MADRDHQMLTWTRIGVVVAFVGATAAVVQCAGGGGEPYMAETSLDMARRETATQSAVISSTTTTPMHPATPDSIGESADDERIEARVASPDLARQPPVTATVARPGSDSQPTPLTFRHRADNGAASDSAPGPAPVPLSLEHRGQ